MSGITATFRAPKYRVHASQSRSITTAPVSQPLTETQPQATLWKWLSGGYRGIESYTCALHRITGLGLLFFLPLHILITSLRAKGFYLWSGHGLLHSPASEFLEFLTFVIFSYHACNGIRLMLLDLITKRGEESPDPTASSVQRRLLLGMMVATLIVLAIGSYAALTEETDESED